MKRRNVFLLFGGKSLIIAGYLCWGARPFYLRPNMEFASDVPSDARNAVNLWVLNSGGLGPEDFDFSRFIENLKNPYEQGAFSPASVSFRERDPWTNREGLLIQHPRKPYIVRFCKGSSGEWLEPTFH